MASLLTQCIPIGCISKAEFRRFYTSLDDWSPLENQGQVTEILKRHDMLGDGGLAFDQFAVLMLQVPWLLTTAQLRSPISDPASRYRASALTGA